MIRLDIGSGSKCKAGFEGVDKKDYGQKYKFDIEKIEPWLRYFKENSVDEIYSSHCLEHIRNINLVMAQIYRVLKPTGKAVIIVPYYITELAFRDPSHVRFFTEHTFYYFNKGYAKEVDYDMEYDFDFEVKIIETNIQVIACLKPIKEVENV